MIDGVKENLKSNSKPTFFHYFSGMDPCLKYYC